MSKFKAFLLIDQAFLKRVGEYISYDNFVERIKTDSQFSEQYGLKIEERELTYEERYKYWFTSNFETGIEYNPIIQPDFDNEYYEQTPNKLIKVTYNSQTEEYYD